MEADVENLIEEPKRYRYEKHNLVVLTLDLCACTMGLAFLDGNAILPLLLHRLGASGLLIGAFAGGRLLAFNLPQLFAARRLHGKPRVKPWFFFTAVITRVPVLLLPWLIWHAEDDAFHRRLAMVLTIAIIGIWALGDGLCNVPWMEIIARSFSNRLRGRWFTATQLITGLLALGAAALIVHPALQSSSLPFPRNYALLALLSAIMFQISLVGVGLIKEPPPVHDDPDPLPGGRKFLKQLPQLVRNNPVFARLATIQLLSGFGAAAAPFYVLYARFQFHNSDSWGAAYQAVQAAGLVALLPLWNWIGERRGQNAAVKGVTAACVLAPLVALTFGRLSPWLFSPTFAMLGGSLDWGLWLVLNHYLLTHVDSLTRPVYVALFSMLFVPAALFPVIGGTMVHRSKFTMIGPFPLLFVLTFLITAAGFLVARGLPEPGLEAEHAN